MESIEDFSLRLFQQNSEFNKNIPSIIKAHQFIDDLTYFLFPIRANQEYTLTQIKQKLNELKLDFQKLIAPFGERLEDSIEIITNKFFDKIPLVYETLLKDANAFIEFDPTAKSVEGIII